MSKKRSILSNDALFWKRARHLRYRIYSILTELVFLGFSGDILLFKIEVSYSGEEARFLFHDEILKRINKLLRFHQKIKENRKIIIPKGFKVKKKYVEVVGERGLSHLSLVIKSVAKDMICEVLTSQEIEKIEKIKKAIRDIFQFSPKCTVFSKADKHTGNYMAQIIFEKIDEAMGSFPIFLGVSGKDAEEIKQKVISLKEHCKSKAK